MKVITIGRSSDNDIIIEDPKVSRAHLQLVQNDNGAFSAVDLNSANGTFVNGQRITGEVHLQPVDTIRIGDTNIQWQQYFMRPVPMSNNTVKDSLSSDSTRVDPGPTPKRLWIWITICSALILAVGAWIFISQSNKARQDNDNLRKEYEENEARLLQEAEQKEARRMQDKADEELFRQELRKDRDKSKAFAAEKQKEAEEAKKQADDANYRADKSDKARLDAAEVAKKANKEKDQAIAAKQEAEVAVEAAKKAEAEAIQAKEAIERESKLSSELTKQFYSEEYETLKKQTAKRACELLEKDVPIDIDAKVFLRDLFNNSDNKGKQEILSAIHRAKLGKTETAKVDTTNLTTTDTSTEEHNK